MPEEHCMNTHGWNVSLRTARTPIRDQIFDIEVYFICDRLAAIIAPSDGLSHRRQSPSLQRDAPRPQLHPMSNKYRLLLRSETNEMV